MEHQPLRPPRTRAGVFAAAMIAPVLLAGCLWARSVPGPYVPEVAGIVAARESAGDGLARYVLENGQTFTLTRSNGDPFIYDAGQAVGDLLLAGHKDGRPWLALIPRGTATDLPAACYELISGGTDRGDSIQTEVGLLLKKAEGFDAGPRTPDGYVPTTYPGMRYQGVEQTFCLNEEGLVTAAR